MSRRQLEHLASYGVNVNHFGPEKLAILYRLQGLFSKKLAIGFCGATGMQGVTNCLETQNWAKEILLKDDKEVPLEVKIEAGKLVAEQGKALTHLMKQLVTNAKEAEERLNTETPVNKPPNIMMPLQVNVNTQPQQPASNGSVTISPTAQPPQ